MQEPTVQPGPPQPGPSQPGPPQPDPSAYDRDCIFREDGPFDPAFMNEAVRTLMRTLPIDPDEPRAWGNRRMHSALLGISALHPRDEIEIMLGVQAMSAYHAAAACWRIGMNHHLPNGDSTRHITTAATSARAFDTLLRAIERRQVKPLAVPVGRPASRRWAMSDPDGFIHDIERRCRGDAAGDDRDPAPDPQAPFIWTAEDLACADEFLERERIAQENEGLDIANTEGILPGGGMIVMDNPTPEQAAYMARRLGLQHRRQYADDLQRGITRLLPIAPIRTGDLIP